MTYLWASATDVGLVREHNEDALWPLSNPEDPVRRGPEDTLVAAVADGMGGHAGGEVASKVAIEAAVAAGGDAVARVRAANTAVMQASRGRPRLAGMGTTMTLALFTQDPAVEIGHIGDSRAYLHRRGKLSQLTRDHSLVAEMVARGELRSDEAAVHPFRSVITRAIGLERSVRVDRLHRDLQAGDRVLLCTDGLTAMLKDHEIATLLSENADPARAAAALVEAANGAGGIDNTSVVVVDLPRDPAG